LSTSTFDTLVICGASGFIGRHAQQYFRASWNVKSITVRKTTNWISIFHPGDTVLFLSGIAHQSKKIQPGLYFEINRDRAWQTAIEARKNKVRQFIYLSTVKVFGEGGIENYDENSACHPEGPYATSKWEAEQKLLTLNDPEFIVTIIRPAVVYGAGVKGNMRQLLQAVKKFPILPFDHLTELRSIIYIKNLLAIIDRSIEKKTSGILLATDEPRTVSEIVREMSKNLQRPKKILSFPRTMNPIVKYLFPKAYNRLFKRFVVNNDLSLERLQLVLPYSFETGIREFVASESRSFTPPT